MRATLFLLLFGIAPLANAAGMMDTLVSQVQSASGGWMSTALGYATNLFFGLAALEFAWSAIQLTLKKSELSEIMVGTLFKVMSLSFFAMVLIKAPEWIPAIINSFKAAGAGVGGTSVLSPSAVFDQGLQVAASLMQFSNDAAPSTGDMIINTLTNSGQGLGKFMLSAIIVGVASVFIVLGYGLIAVQLLITLVESYLIIGGGALMLGFSGSRWTHNLSEKYFGYAISIGVKLFTIYLIIGFGDSFTQALKDTIAAAYAAHPEGPSFGDYLGVGGASLFYGVTGYMAPGLAGSMLNGTVAMSLQSAGTAAGMVGGAPVAAGLAASAAGARALGLAGGAMGALLPVQKAAGAIGGSSAGVGFGGGISGTVNANNPFQPAAGPSNTRKSSSANSGGTGITPLLALPGPSGLPTASSSASQHARARTPSEGPVPYNAAPGPSESPMAGRGMNASGQSLGKTQAPGFVDPRFDPSATPGGGAKQSTNETGGTSANSFDARSFQQRFEADYKQHPGGMADKLNSFSKRLQHAADRRKPHWVSDGHVGHAPGLRMGLDT
ncbi:P-type conjugative transfer protein TrbL [Rhodoferax sp.]|uniref:P-type conjugative transfer protein TrbL n=1 Tax=Rhodoferax sp. TaxID=50421 RepID=UPI0026157225|nr:P-type conjugative transfer protein TrbL [Rhodoferax sp.]MDD2920110.1 P-type conjugative transfer protein TrbL [Rhodoferax sp.]